MGENMKNLTIEIQHRPAFHETICWVSAPAYGDSARPAKGAIRTLILRNETHRVKVGVYDHDLPDDHIKQIAREVVGRYTS
jgi:hypothetical protein